MNKIIIEKDNLQHNIQVIKDKVKDFKDDNGKTVRIIAVLKGNAYGMDSSLVAKRLLDNNINFFAVSEISEGIKLRDEAFTNSILLLESTTIDSEVKDIVKYDLIATLGSIEAINKLGAEAALANKMIEAHLKIDTGFGRFGFIINDDVVSDIKNALENNPSIKITGTYSHFIESYADDDKKTSEQFCKFIDAIAKLKKAKIETGILHMCNSSAVFKYPNMYLNAVRVGSALTGRLQIKNTTGLKRVGYLESRVCEIRKLNKGTTIGYSGTACLKEDSTVAIVEAGYADGVGLSGPRDSVRLIDKLRKIKLALKTLKEDGRTFVTIGDKKYPILGRIGMKNFMVDVSNSDVKISDKVKIDVNLIFVDSKIKRQEI